jgi:6,7-dimethyl-8-ribityllumazine synthase
MQVLATSRHNGNKKDIALLQQILSALGVEGTPAPKDSKSADFWPSLSLFQLVSSSSEAPGTQFSFQVSDPHLALQIAKRSGAKILGDVSEKELATAGFQVKLPSGTTVHFGALPMFPDLWQVPGIAGSLNAAGKSFAIVVARFNAFITERLLQAAYDGLVRSGALRENITVVRVPGAFEIPSASRTLAETGDFDAILCIGCLLRGDTAHYDVIVNEVTRGIGQSAQESGIPHAFGVLTCDTLEQAIDRAGLKMGNKGLEAAAAAIEMANLGESIRGPHAKHKKKPAKTKPRGEKI